MLSDEYFSVCSSLIELLPIGDFRWRPAEHTAKLDIRTHSPRSRFPQGCRPSRVGERTQWNNTSGSRLVRLILLCLRLLQIALLLIRLLPCCILLHTAKNNILTRSPRCRFPQGCLPSRVGERAQRNNTSVLEDKQTHGMSCRTAEN